MIEIVVTHPDYPSDATVRAVECLNQSQVHNQTLEKTIAIPDPAEFDHGVRAL